MQTPVLLLNPTLAAQGSLEGTSVVEAATVAAVDSVGVPEVFPIRLRVRLCSFPALEREVRRE